MLAVCERSQCGELYHGDSDDDHVCPECVYKTLKIEDAVGYDEDTPKDAVVCPKCWGCGIVPVFAQMELTAKDCDTCDCNGWIVIPF